MKKIILTSVLLLLVFTFTFAETEVEVEIPEYDVRVNDVLIDTSHSQYPVITYKDVTYFPMTSDYANGIGLNISYSNESGLKILKESRKNPLTQSFLEGNNLLGSKHKAKEADFDIRVNGVQLVNTEEPYPVLLFRNITYFPMTWRFAVTEFGWQTKWSADTGFAIIVEEEKNYPEARIEFENNDVITVELYPNIAPNTVNNFISLAQSNYYDGLIFHRVIADFMIQGGDPTGTGRGGPGYTIPAEFTYLEDEIEKSLSHQRGVISMARSMDPDSAGSQFFIMHQNGAYLDKKYTAFGKVIKGIEVVDKIANTRVDLMDKPLEDVIIKSISIDLNSYEVKEVIKSSE